MNEALGCGNGREWLLCAVLWFISETDRIMEPHWGWPTLNSTGVFMWHMAAAAVSVTDGPTRSVHSVAQ